MAHPITYGKHNNVYFLHAQKGLKIDIAAFFDTEDAHVKRVKGLCTTENARRVWKTMKQEIDQFDFTLRTSEKEFIDMVSTFGN